MGVGTGAYFFSEDGWYFFNGVTVQPIGGGKIDRYFIADFDDGYKDNMWSAVDTDKKLIYWAYPGSGNTSGRPNKLLIYNYLTGMWSRGEMEIECLGSMLSVGYTLEDLDAFGTIDTLPFSLDSRAWAGGGAYVGVVNDEHKLGQLSGSNLQADIETGLFAADQDDNRLVVTGIRPHVDASGTTVALGWRDNEHAAVTTTAYRAVGSDRYAPHRQALRYAQVKIRVPAAASWTKAHGFTLRARTEGRR